MEDKEKELLIREAQQSIGYHESQHKDDYMTGLSEGFFLSKDFYENRIKMLESSLDFFTKRYEKSLKDFKTINDIFDYYKDLSTP